MLHYYRKCFWNSKAKSGDSSKGDNTLVPLEIESVELSLKLGLKLERINFAAEFKTLKYVQQLRFGAFTISHEQSKVSTQIMA